MTDTLSPLQLLDYYLSLGIDRATSSHPVNKTKQTIPLIKQAQETIKSKQEEPKAISSKPKVDVDINQIKTLNDLQEALLNFDGCDLKKTALNTVFSDGNPQAPVMLIGEAPGADEDKQGKPFVGLSGQLLHKIMASIGLTRDHFYLTNIIPWRPPANRQPTPHETHLCLPFVKKHIELIDPAILIFVGGTAVKTLMDTTQGIMKMRGRWLTYKGQKEYQAFSLYHPAYLLRSPGQKRAVWQDMLMIKEKLVQLTILKPHDGF